MAEIGQNDESFGPLVQGARSNFDFTLVFEYVVLSIIPVSIFQVLAILRVGSLIRKPSLVQGLSFRLAKLGIISVYTALQLSLLTLIGIRSNVARRTAISAAALHLVSAFFFGALSFLEHSKSLRPSFLLNSYIFLSLLLDATRCRTLLLISTTSTISRLSTAATGVKFILLVFESFPKTRWIRSPVPTRTPEDTIGVFSMSFFFWLNQFIAQGYRKILTVDELFPLQPAMRADNLGPKFWRAWTDGSNHGRKRRLLLALIKALRWSLIAPIPPRLAGIAFDFCQPLLIIAVENYLQTPASLQSKYTGQALIGATVLVYLGITFCTGIHEYFHQRAIVMIRGCLVAGIFKQTTLHTIHSGDNSASITLMSTDVEKLRFATMSIHEIWANTIQAGLAAWLLWKQLGSAFLVPFGVVLLCFILTLIVSKFAPKRMAAWRQATQARVGSMAAVISNMRSLKISGLAKQLGGLMQTMRNSEVEAGRHFRQLQVFSAIVAFTPLLVSPILTFAATSHNVDTTRAFASLALLILLADPLSQVFQAIPTLIAAVASFDRIAAFLSLESRSEYRRHQPLPTSVISTDRTPLLTEVEKAQIIGHAASTATDEPAFMLENCQSGWKKDNVVLKHTNLKIPKSKLTMVVGPVGSGKSAFCKLLLGEMPCVQGDVVSNVGSRIGFCDQTPFLPNHKIRDVIVGHSDYDATWYNQVIDVTALQPDFETLVKGDQSLVGPNGSALSGGQKHRVAIARALYSRSQVLVFDDIFSGLDSSTENIIFNRVFGPKGLLKRHNATTILCTHNVRHLPNADHIIALGRDGSVVEEGTFIHLNANKSYVQSLNIQVSETISSDDEFTPIPQPSKARVAGDLTTGSQFDDRKRQIGDITVYVHYFATLPLALILLFVVTVVVTGFCYNFSTVWLKFWSDHNANHPHEQTRRGYYLGIYTIIQVIALAALAVAVYIVDVTMAASTGSLFHLRALRTVMTAPLSLFTSNEVGVILNRFSQDLNILDTELGMSFINTALSSSITLGLAAVIATASPYIWIFYPFLLALLYCLQRVYLRTSRQLRFLDLEAKSPLFTQFVETLTGLITIRAFGWVDAGIAKNHLLLDFSQRPVYLLAMIQQWLGVTLNLAVAVLATILVSLATQLRASSGFTAASLVSVMTFGQMLANIVRSWTMLETSIGSVSRLNTFTKVVESENLPSEDEMPPEDWPQRGAIEIRNVSASYTKHSIEGLHDKLDKQDDQLAIRRLTLSINPGEKVAVCGRTGSGKSSIILLLLRLLDGLPAEDHEISIDSMPLHLIDRETLRSRILALPQDPFFLPDGNTFRSNLDPYGGATITDCESVLQQVGLWEVIDQRGGLETPMTADTFSQGQKQLFSVARVLLRARARTKAAILDTSEKSNKPGGILLLDEISSSVDAHTDVLIQQIIRKEFENYTVVTIAHRMDSVKDYDRMIVMENGRIKEAGSPSIMGHLKL